MLTLLSFLVALGLLIAIHEYGHYRVARACGVKVLRFSIGFGRVLFRWQPKGSPTEFTLSALPLGGYVKFLDESDGPVPPEERHLAFNTQPVGKRAAIVAAGPIANLLLAVLIYTFVNFAGKEEPRAILSTPLPASMAEKAGVRGGDLVLRAAWNNEALSPVESFEDLRWMLTRGALNGRNVRMEVQSSKDSTETVREVTLSLASMTVREVDARLFREIGIVAPWTESMIGELMPDMAGAKAGLKQGDRVLFVGEKAIADGTQLREAIRASVGNGVPTKQAWRIERDGQPLTIDVAPDAFQEGTLTVGRIGAIVGTYAETTMVRDGPIEALSNGVARTWEISALTLRMFGRMLTGEASIKNLSGPLTIADYAGKSASQGITPYLLFLAMISISLGILNLLPLPVLDGGHLAFYAWEAVRGKPLSEVWMDRLQRTGVGLLLMMMTIAMVNDVTRLFL